MKHSIVDSEWLNEQLLKFGLKQYEVYQELGLTKNQFSKWVNNKLPISNTMQTVLYYYFRCLELEKELNK